MNSFYKILLFSIAMIIIAGFIGWMFWVQEIQYTLPTPMPKDFVNIPTGSKIDLKNELGENHGKPRLLHFYSPDCPCSKFQMRDFESMVHYYQDRVDFYVVIQSMDKEAGKIFINKYGIEVPTIVDEDGLISDKCGIYSTPQAVILDGESCIYFKGNYNKARYCTRRETKFAEIAIDSLLENKPLPLFMNYALTEPYGCTLPSDEESVKEAGLFFLF